MKLAKFKKLKFQSYKPGKYEIPNLRETRKIIKLSANESALGTSPKVRAILRKNVSTSKYPDYTSKLLRKEGYDRLLSYNVLYETKCKKDQETAPKLTRVNSVLRSIPSEFSRICR